MIPSLACYELHYSICSINANRYTRAACTLTSSTFDDFESFNCIRTDDSFWPAWGAAVPAQGFTLLSTFDDNKVHYMHGSDYISHSACLFGPGH